MRHFAELQNWEIQEYIDHENGKHANSPQFRAIFDAAAWREFDIVLFWAPDRLSREWPLENPTAFKPAEQLFSRI
jgi:DNA invertase Pin-like site-specific DNA recombinase